MSVIFSFSFFLNLRENDQVDGKIQREKECLIFDFVFNDINVLLLCCISISFFAKITSKYFISLFVFIVLKFVTISENNFLKQYPRFHTLSPTCVIYMLVLYFIDLVVTGGILILYVLAMPKFFC